MLNLAQSLSESTYIFFPSIGTGILLMIQFLTFFSITLPRRKIVLYKMTLAMSFLLVIMSVANVFLCLSWGRDSDFPFVIILLIILLIFLMGSRMISSFNKILNDYKFDLVKSGEMKKTAFLKLFNNPPVSDLLRRQCLFSYLLFFILIFSVFNFLVEIDMDEKYYVLYFTGLACFFFLKYFLDLFFTRTVIFLVFFTFDEKERSRVGL